MKIYGKQLSHLQGPSEVAMRQYEVPNHLQGILWMFVFIILHQILNLFLHNMTFTKPSVSLHQSHSYFCHCQGWRTVVTCPRYALTCLALSITLSWSQMCPLMPTKDSRRKCGRSFFRTAV